MRRLPLLLLTLFLASGCLQEAPPGDGQTITSDEQIGTSDELEITGDEQIITDDNETITYAIRQSCEPSPDPSSPPVVSAGAPLGAGSAGMADAVPRRPLGDETNTLVTSQPEHIASSRYGMEASQRAVAAWRLEKQHLLETMDIDPDEKTLLILLLRHSNLTTTRAAVGAVLEGSSIETATSICTGTLISCNLVLTARHCVGHVEPRANKYWVYFQHSGIFEVDEDGIDIFCNSLDCSSEEYPEPYNDLALLKLKNHIRDLTPVALGDNCDWDSGEPADIVGFGVSSLSLGDYNLKRHASITLADCVGDLNDERFICYKLGTELPGACNHDSGGPLLAVGDSGEARLVGVLIKTSSMCTTDQARYNNTTSTVFAPWITEAISNSQDECAAVDGPFDEIQSVPQGRLDAVNVVDIYDFDVGENAGVLKVGLNYPPGSSLPQMGNRFNLDVYKLSDSGVEDDSVEVPCLNKGGHVSICSKESPPSGHWRAAVSREKGNDYYQLVATTHAN